ncbi:c-type cytochrome [Pampinifervens diazotrophicum]
MALDYLTEKTLKGGAGVWGSIPMLPQKVKEAEARQIVKWILSLE